jgi:hypothetical protein
MGGLLVDRDRVHIGGVRRVGDGRTLLAGALDDLLDEEVRPVRALDLQHAVERVEPLLGLDRVEIATAFHVVLPKVILDRRVELPQASAFFVPPPCFRNSSGIARV